MASTHRIQAFMVIVSLCVIGTGITSTARGGITYSYDFESFTVNNGDSIDGKDNWVIGSGTAVVYNYWNNELGDDNAVCFSASTDSHIYREGNDWSFAIPDDSILTVEWTARIGTSYNTALALGPDKNSKLAFQMWSNTTNGWWFRDAIGNGTYSTDNYATGNNEIWRVCLTVDLAANGGDGAASLSTGIITGGTYTLTAISGMQDMNMNLTQSAWDTDGVKGSDLQSLFLRGNSGGAIDDISITVSAVPEPSMIVMLLGGLSFLFAKRYRKAD